MQNKSYEIKLGKLSLLLLLVTLFVISCKKDDDGDEFITIEIRDRAEQQLADKDSIAKYFDTHYYNSQELESIPNPSVSDIIITRFADGETVAPDGHTKLSDPGVVQTKSVVFADTDYEFYVLELNQGGGSKSPKFSDNVLVSYEGFKLDDVVFDSAVTPVEFDLLSLIPAWNKVLPDFNTAESFVENNDGTVNYINQGLGVMFIPSGLAYFSNPTSSIPAYSPIIFKFELLQTSTNDHDNDGIPSYLEDLNGDKDFNVNFENLEDTTDDDTDGDGTPDYADNDDDGDGILTINEDTNNDGDPTNDIGSNGIPRYLDPTE
jgi:hypothetical protein